MSYDIAKAFPIGSYRTSAATDLPGLLGTSVIYFSKTYRLVQNGALDITSPSGKGVTTAMSAGVPTWVVALPSDTTGLGKAGVIPSDYGSTTIPASAFFWIQTSGPSAILAAATTTTSGKTLGLNTSGQAAVLATTVDAQAMSLAYVGYSTNTAAATAAGQPITVILDGVVH